MDNPDCVVYSNIINHEVEFVQKQDEWKHKWEKDIMYYDVEYHDSLKLISEKQLKRAVSLAMTTWDIEIPVTFKPSWWRLGPSDINIKFESRDDNKYFKEHPSVLAYAYLPGQGTYSGKIVFCTDYIWDLNGKGIKGSEALKKGIVKGASPDNILKTYNINHVLIHELGHSLGLRHDVNRNTTDVMDPYYKGTTLDLSDNDIIRIRLKYGIRKFNNWKRYTRLKRWLKRRIRRG